MADESIEGVFREPFNEQVAFFRQKLGNQVPTERWTDIQKEAHDKAFMVAGATKAELLSDLAAAVDKAISQGITLKDFRKDFKSIVERHGWNYKGEFNWRTRVIYSTNLATSYAAGRLAQLQEFEYWAYKHSGATHPRMDHKSWHNKVLPASDPWWQTHYPPNGWGCGCRVVGYSSVDDAEMQGGKLDPAPDSSIDPNTGLPVGIGKGWDYMPGKTVVDTVKAMAQQTQHWDYVLAKAYMTDLPDSVKSMFGRSYRGLPSTADDVRRFAKRIIEERPNTQEYQTMGLVEEKHIGAIEEMEFKTTTGDVMHSKVKVRDYDFTLDPSSIKHIQTRHGSAQAEHGRKQRPVSEDDYARLPEILNNPDELLSVGVSRLTKHPLVRYQKNFGDETYVYTMEVRKKRRMLVAQSFWIEQ